MTPTMGAALVVGGVEIASSYDGSAITALAKLTFDWGRDTLYDDVDPGVLRFTVIDRLGQWATDRTLTGQPVTLERTTPTRRIFRGSISRVVVRRGTLRNPSTKVREPVWFVDLTASSVMADLASAVFPGPSLEGTVEGLGGWREVGQSTRVLDIIAAGAGGIVDTIANAGEISSSVVRRMRSVDASRAESVLQLISRVYKLAPLAAVNYDPATHAVTPARFGVASNVVLSYAGGKTTIALPTGRVMPAEKIAVPDGYSAESSVADAIDAVQVEYTWYGKDPALSPGSQKRTTYLSRSIQRVMSRSTGRTRRILKIESGLITLDPTEFGYDVGPTNAAPAWLLQEASSIVETLNNQLRLPRLRFDAERLPLGDASLTEIAFTPTTSTTPLYFAGSVFNGLQNAGPQYQIIGGTLTYDRGWTHDVNLAPVRTAPREPLALAALFGSTSAATWASFDDSIRLSDFDTITQGL